MANKRVQANELQNGDKIEGKWINSAENFGTIVAVRFEGYGLEARTWFQADEKVWIDD